MYNYVLIKLRIFQKGFNYSQDGEGNRLVYHLCGCNLRCPWCSNPEGLSADGGREILSPDGLPYTPEAIVQEALSCKPMFFDGGGVTFTGGEPTLQFDALQESLRLLKENGINTAMETNATHPRLPELFPLVDNLIMDFKHIDDEVHRNVTGLSNAAVKANLRKAFARHGRVLIRTVLVHGFNDTEEYARAFAKSYALINPNFRVSTFNGYRDPTAVYGDIEPNAEFPPEHIEKVKREQAETDSFPISSLR